MRPHMRNVCQSCGMPIPRRGDHGTDLGGRLDEDYCHHCFSEGSFTQPNVSLDEMIDRMAGFAGELNKTPNEAVAYARRLLPTLKRWRDSTP